MSLARWRNYCICKLLAIFGLAMLLLLLTPLLAEAHAQYDHSNPPANARLPAGQPPTYVQVWFTEQVDPSFSKLSVFDQQRREIDLADSHVAPDNPSSLVISLRPGLADGAYTVVFQTVSAEDGHQVTSAFGFVVGAGPLPASTTALLSQVQTTDANFNAWSVGLRWLNYLGLTGLVGGLVFLLLVWRPSAIQLKVQSAVSPLEKASIQIETRVQWFSCWCLLILILGWVGFLIYQASIVTASAPWLIFGNGALLTLLLRSRFGMLWLVRLVLLIVACIVWYFLARRKATQARLKILPWLLLSAGLAMMSTNALASHAAAGQAPWLLVSADFVHLVSTSLWIGGLFAFVLILPVALRELVAGTGDRTRVLAHVIPRFTILAIISVMLLAVTGIVQALVLLHVSGAVVNGDYGQVVAAFLGSEYGRALTIKSALFAVLILLGAINACWISPQMRRYAIRAGGDNGAGSLAAGRLQRVFRRTVTSEVMIAVCLLLVVGNLTSLSPPPASSTTGGSGPLLRQGQIGDLTYRLAISPGKPGLNTFEVVLTEKNGQLVQHVDAVIGYFIMQDMNMGVEVLDLPLLKDASGSYGTTASVLSMAGRWEIRLIVRRTGYDDAKAVIQCSIV